MYVMTSITSPAGSMIINHWYDITYIYIYIYIYNYVYSVYVCTIFTL